MFGEGFCHGPWSCCCACVPTAPFPSPTPFCVLPQGPILPFSLSFNAITTFPAASCGFGILPFGVPALSVRSGPGAQLRSALRARWAPRLLSQRSKFSSLLFHSPALASRWVCRQLSPQSVVFRNAVEPNQPFWTSVGLLGGVFSLVAGSDPQRAHRGSTERQPRHRSPPAHEPCLAGLRSSCCSWRGARLGFPAFLLNQAPVGEAFSFLPEVYGRPAALHRRGAGARQRRRRFAVSFLTVPLEANPACRSVLSCRKREEEERRGALKIKSRPCHHLF